MFLSHRYFYIQCLPCIDIARAHCLAAIAKYPCRHGRLAHCFAEIKSPATASTVPPADIQVTGSFRTSAEVTTVITGTI